MPGDRGCSLLAIGRQSYGASLRTRDVRLSREDLEVIIEKRVELTMRQKF